MLLALLYYKASPEEMEPYVKGHISFLEEAYAQEAFVVSGQMMPDKGGIILSPLTRKGEFEQILRKDPFIAHDLVSYEIIAFEPSRFQAQFASFIREPEKREIALTPYTHEWEESFKKEATVLTTILNEQLVAIHHIGSTAIPGIVAKPTIDILPVVKNINNIDQLNKSFIKLGYEPLGEFGMPGRRFFTKSKDGKRLFHVHIFEEGHPDIERHLRFRDYLRTHPKESRAYSKLKKELVKVSPNDIEKYCWGKEDFIKAIEGKSLFWQAIQRKEEDD